MKKTTTLHILSIDASRYDGGWRWSQWFNQKTVEIPVKDITPRKITRLLRELEYLPWESRGKVRVDRRGTGSSYSIARAAATQYIEVQIKATREPLYALVEY